MYFVKLLKATNLKMCLRLTEMYSKVLHSQRIQYDTARIQLHYHHKEHSEVKKQSILSYPLVVLITHKINYPNTYFEYLLFRAYCDKAPTCQSQYKELRYRIKQYSHAKALKYATSFISSIAI